MVNIHIDAGLVQSFVQVVTSHVTCNLSHISLVHTHVTILLYYLRSIYHFKIFLAPEFIDIFPM